MTMYLHFLTLLLGQSSAPSATGSQDAILSPVVPNVNKVSCKLNNFEHRCHL